jgi:hypothetical protein
MTEQIPSPSSPEAKQLLGVLWKVVLDESEESPINEDIEILVNSDYVSIRYCLPTQVLGKLVQPSVNCLCLQKGDASRPGAWDPRSFCIKTIVPWVAENQFVLGNSTDPYVSKPLRKPVLEDSPENVKGASQWRLLYRILKTIQERNSTAYTKKVFLDVLRSIKRKLSNAVFEYPVPKRASMEQVATIIERFLGESSGGERGLAVAAALFETFGSFFHLYSRIQRHAINAADKATGSTADIDCFGENGELKISIEVKERNVTLTDVRSAIDKSRRVSLRELLFNAPGFEPKEEQKIRETIDRAWASGTNLYRIGIFELVNVGLSIAGEEARVFFLERIGRQLDAYNTQPSNRNRWKELLESI